MPHGKQTGLSEIVIAVIVVVLFLTVLIVFLIALLIHRKRRIAREENSRFAHQVSI